MEKQSSKTEISTEVINEGKTIAIIAYITVIGLIIAFVMNNEKKNTFASYHIRQSLGLTIAAIALSVIGIIPILGWLISFFGFFIILFLWIMGLINVFNSKIKPLPLIGVKFEEWFKDVQ